MEEKLLTFKQWVNVEYGIVGREFKELPEPKKQRIKKEYDKYVEYLGKDNK